MEKLQNSIVQRTVDAICSDIEQTAREITDRTAATVFFGGGTPTLLSSHQLTSILQTVRSNFPMLPDTEISSEANPSSSDSDKFGAMFSAGFNRLSIGVQSFNDKLLVDLDRFHSSAEAYSALQLARSAGFTNINLDLMFGLPNQTRELWRDSLDRAINFGVQHLSLYALTLEPGTKFERQHAGGRLSLPDEDDELAMYEESIGLLNGSGYEQYEVSNFAKPGYRCSHNQVYWRNDEYLGFGPGAVSYYNGKRYKRERLPKKYAEKVESGAPLTVECEELSGEGALGETMMLGLRLIEGIEIDSVIARFGIDPLVHFSDKIAKLDKLGLLVSNGKTMRLTHRGLLLANTVLAEFLSD